MNKFVIRKSHRSQGSSLTDSLEKNLRVATDIMYFYYGALIIYIKLISIFIFLSFI